jgi:hypothetical protein
VPFTSHYPPASLIPPQLGLARLSITGFATLKPAEQMQAAALALYRELSVDPKQLRLAVQAMPDDPNAARVAFCKPLANSKATLETSLLAAMQQGRAFWVDAPAGFIVGPRGAAAVDFAGTHDALPSVVEGTLSHFGSDTTARCTLVNRDRSLVTDERMAWWAAASGVTMVDGEMPVTTPVTLIAAPHGRIAPRKTAVDWALQWTAIASALCLVLSGLRYANSSAAGSMATAGANTAQSQALPGALLDRVATIAPDLVAQTQSATFASGAWVLALPDSFDAAAIKRSARAMQANGLAVQSTLAPSPRIRIQLP